MKTLRMYPSSLNDRYLDEVADTLQNGGIIIYPTDTLYALGCDALNNGAIERLCKVKGMNPQKQTLSIICDGLSMASEYARIDNEAFRILRTNLPGPLHLYFLHPPLFPRCSRDGARRVCECPTMPLRVPLPSVSVTRYSLRQSLRIVMGSTL